MGVVRAQKLIILPGGGPRTVKSALLHAISLAFHALTDARGKATSSPNTRHRLQADLGQART